MTDKQRITEILKAYTKKHNISASSVILEEYAEELLANGVIVPPCEVGDMVYKINGSRIEKFKVARFVISSYGIRVEDLYGVQVVLIDDFEKTVFLTKEEAEQALAERKDNNG